MIVRRQVSSKKVLNLIGALWNYWRKNVKPGTYPVALVLDPIEACNLGCFMCPVGTRDKSLPSPRLAFKDYCSIIDEVKDYIGIVVPYVNGEPFLNPQFLDMVEYSHRKRIYVLTSTNGHFAGRTQELAERLVTSGMDHLIITISGATQDTYIRYHKNGNLDKVLSNARRIVEAKRRLKKRTPYITFRYLKFAYNLAEIEMARQIAKKIGVNEIVFREARVGYSDDSGQIYDKKRKTEYMKSFVQTDRQSSHNTVGQCAWPWLIGIINANGMVPVCTQYCNISSPDSENNMGDVIITKSFKEVWLGDRFQKIRHNISERQQAMSFCRECLRSVGFGDEV